MSERYLIVMNNDLTRKNLELQKKVDQLTNQNLELQKENIRILTTLVSKNEDIIKLSLDLINTNKVRISNYEGLGLDKKVELETAHWIYWPGWAGNHDKRIEDARCSKCGYIHTTVYGTPKRLMYTCPKCESKMTIEED